MPVANAEEAKLRRNDVSCCAVLTNLGTTFCGLIIDPLLSFFFLDFSFCDCLNREVGRPTFCVRFGGFRYGNYFGMWGFLKMEAAKSSQNVRTSVLDHVGSQPTRRKYYYMWVLSECFVTVIKTLLYCISCFLLPSVLTTQHATRNTQANSR